MKQCIINCIMLYASMFSLYVTVSTEATQHILSSPRVTNFGEWGDWEHCPNKSYIFGMRLKTEPVQGPVDDTALNGIQFLCGMPDEFDKLTAVKRIQSRFGSWGTWGTTQECDGYAIGFQLRSEPSQGDGDDTAANNVRLFCSKSKGFLEGGGLNWGHWTALQICPKGQVMCGLRTQLESSQGPNADDTALNNLDVECCAL